MRGRGMRNEGEGAVRDRAAPSTLSLTTGPRVTHSSQLSFTKAVSCEFSVVQSSVSLTLIPRSRPRSSAIDEVAPRALRERHDLRYGPVDDLVRVLSRQQRDARRRAPEPQVDA